MLLWWRHLRRRVTRYLTAGDWKPLFFSPILYLFVWAASIRLAINPGGEPDFTVFGGDPFYHLWLTLGITAPMWVAVAWILVRWFPGRPRYVGLWLRLGGNLGVFTATLTMHIGLALLSAPPQYDEGRIWSRYVQAAVLVFLLELIARDVAVLRATEIAAHGRQQ